MAYLMQQLYEIMFFDHHVKSEWHTAQRELKEKKELFISLCLPEFIMLI